MLPNTSFSDHMGLGTVFISSRKTESPEDAVEGITELNAETAVMFKQGEVERKLTMWGLQAGQGWGWGRSRNKGVGQAGRTSQGGRDEDP